MSCLRLVLGDQLNDQISSLSDIDKDSDTVLFCEVLEEATYVKHHKKKIAFIFSAMRHFASDLIEQGYSVRYIRLDNPENTGSFVGELARAVQQLKPTRIVVTEPAEYRVLKALRHYCSESNTAMEIRTDNRFLCSHQEFQDWATGRKQLRMEYFYREMRKKYAVLMDGSKPEGGVWNYDQQNRKPPRQGLSIPETYIAEPDDITREVIALVDEHFSDHFGDLNPFHFAVTRTQALHALEQFIDERLPLFGDYQDAMLENEPWMYHSHLAFYLNIGLLLPIECVHLAERAYRNEDAPLSAVEGFIRQILGWREYVRGIYWHRMPDYESLNFLGASRPLPDFFWTSNTDMNCLKQTISETKSNAYAHHIQRLMVLGNFALLAGLDPHEVNEWYLIVYADAFQWVELPNVTGMVLFADGGVLGSKPYAASGAYINRMSDYCRGCRYAVSQKTGPDACPFNYLYWDFLIRNQHQLRTNNRLGMVYKTLERMDTERIELIQTDSRRFLEKIDAKTLV